MLILDSAAKKQRDFGIPLNKLIFYEKGQAFHLGSFILDKIKIIMREKNTSRSCTKGDPKKQLELSSGGQAPCTTSFPTS